MKHSASYWLQTPCKIDALHNAMSEFNFESSIGLSILGLVLTMSSNDEFDDEITSIVEDSLQSQGITAKRIKV